MFLFHQENSVTVTEDCGTMMNKNVWKLRGLNFLFLVPFFFYIYLSFFSVVTFNILLSMLFVGVIRMNWGVDCCTRCGFVRLFQTFVSNIRCMPIICYIEHIQSSNQFFSKKEKKVTFVLWHIRRSYVRIL